MSEETTVILDKRKLLLKHEKPMECEFVINTLENFIDCDVSAHDIQFNEDKQMALVSFSEDVDVEVVREKARQKLKEKLHFEHPPVNSKVIVRNLPLGVDKDMVMLYFEAKNKCPASAIVKNVDKYDDGPDHWTAVVEFEESSAVDRVVAANHPNLAENLQFEVWSPVSILKCTKSLDCKPACTADGELGEGRSNDKGPNASPQGMDGEFAAGNRMLKTSKSETVNEHVYVSKMPVTVDHQFAGRDPVVSTSHLNKNQQNNYQNSGDEEPERRTNDKGPNASPRGSSRELAKTANRQSMSSKQTTIAVKNKDALDMMRKMLYEGGLLREFGCSEETDRQKSGIRGIILSGEDETKLLTLSSMLTAFANERLYTRDLPISPVLAQRLLRYSAAWVYKMMRKGCDKGDVMMAFTEQNNQPFVVALKQTVADRAAKNLFDHLLCGKVTIDEYKRRRFTASSTINDRLKEIDADRPVIVQTDKSAITVIGVPSFVVRVVGEIHDLLS